MVLPNPYNTVERIGEKDRLTGSGCENLRKVGKKTVRKQS